jgi:hypothetical protein
VTGPAGADQPRQRLLGKYMNLVSGIVEERCLNQYADFKEVKTKNSKGWTKQEDESSPPPAWQHQSAHKGGNCNNGVDCSPSSSLQFRFSTL